MINLWCYHEGWTSDCCNNLGWTVVSGEMPIELRYILFSAKVILVMFSLHKCGVKLSFIIYFQYMNGSCNNRSTYGYVQVVNNNV